ncbi:hypothetical protein PENSUB_6549 [Penicillium subrubescens]|uniref:Uncharacterized protein n=1 Tax=Penicillium subrubescens TaxID=1316194 RepID=A0A1Q5U029_9EURO|nr:hypothetical protein PENSUB_6549 [Penicillium subrubescens]
MTNCRQSRECFHANLAVEPASNTVERVIILLCAMQNYESISNRANVLPESPLTIVPDLSPYTDRESNHFPFKIYGNVMNANYNSGGSNTILSWLTSSNFQGYLSYNSATSNWVDRNGIGNAYYGAIEDYNVGLG